MKTTIVAVALLLSALSAHAQPLQDAVKAYAVAAALDGVTTYAGMRGGGTETNPVLARLGRQNPALTVAFNGAVDLGAVLFWKRLGQTHPKAATIGLYSTAALRVFIVHHNLESLRTMTR